MLDDLFSTLISFVLAAFLIVVFTAFFVFYSLAVAAADLGYCDLVFYSDADGVLEDCLFACGGALLSS